LSQISQAISCFFNALLAESLYTVKSSDNTFVLTLDRGTGAKAGALLNMGWSTVFAKNSVLANRLPGTAVCYGLTTPRSATVNPCTLPWLCARPRISLVPSSTGAEENRK
jgi:hypothetical protein